MIVSPNHNNQILSGTSHKVVIPFYGYAALAFLAATILLLGSANAFTGHYFHPHILAIAHLMALGWGTMIILGASHQLVPVLIEGKLYSTKLGYVSFALAGAGIPLLVYGFYTFNLHWPAWTGGIMINLAVLAYLINLALSIKNSKNENLHALFIFTAGTWLFITTALGLLLLFNFTYVLLQKDSLNYLNLHAHLGIAGWFLLMVMGVGTRLIPMFLISAYKNNRLLWIMYSCINLALLFLFMLSVLETSEITYIIPIVLFIISILSFVWYCLESYRRRLRKRLDEPMKISLLSAAMMALPLILLAILLINRLLTGQQNNLALAYGFTIFFGWLTAIILGMTFKTLPFIVWNKQFKEKSGKSISANPKDLFSIQLFNLMGLFYISGFLVFVTGIFFVDTWLLKTGAGLFLLTAIAYNFNIYKIIFPSRKKHGNH